MNRACGQAVLALTLTLAALAQQATESAVDAYLQRDAGLCQYVRQNETAINTAQRELDGDLDEHAFEGRVASTRTRIMLVGKPGHAS